MLPPSAEGSLSVLVGVVGSPVVGVSRIHFQIGDSIDESNGAIELAFDGEQTVRFDAGADGESLVIVSEEWEDPFVEPLSDENLAYVAASGKWTKFDQSSSRCSALIGSTLEDFMPHILDDGRLTGVTLRFDTSLFVRVQCIADELIVDFAG